MRHSLPASALTALLLALAACAGPSPPPAPAAAPAASAPAALPRTVAPAGASVRIVSPADGAEVRSPVTVQFAIEGMALAPAGTNDPGTGHHHLLVDVDLPAPDQPIPKDAGHLHFGQGQAEATVELAPGTHRLQLLLGDGNHVPHDPPIVSAPVTITVR